MTTASDIALIIFTASNTLRIVAYLPQMIKICKDTCGASAISYTTWGLFGVSHLSTVAYAILTLHDYRLALIFSINAAACAVIIALTLFKRLRIAPQRMLALPKDCRGLPSAWRRRAFLRNAKSPDCRQVRFRNFAGWLFLIAYFGVSFGSAAAENAQQAATRPDLARACAAYELHFRTLIDDLGETGEASDSELSDAAFAVIAAQVACAAKEFETALLIYESIDLLPASLELLEDLRAVMPPATRRGNRGNGHAATAAQIEPNR